MSKDARKFPIRDVISIDEAKLPLNASCGNLVLCMQGMQDL